MAFLRFPVAMTIGFMAPWKNAQLSKLLKDGRVALFTWPFDAADDSRRGMEKCLADYVAEDWGGDMVLMAVGQYPVAMAVSDRVIFSVNRPRAMEKCRTINVTGS